MTTLPHTWLPVQTIDIAIVALPERLADADADEHDYEPEPFQPSADDEAYDLGYRLGRDGELARCPRHLHGNRAWMFTLGQVRGRQARDNATARELGRTLTLQMGPIDPPAGLSSDEAKAFRQGVELGLDELEAELEFDAWVASEEAERSGLAFADSITDEHIYRLGAVS